jgi:hypothetical protein
MQLPPAVIIHGLADAKTALSPGLPVTLLSARGAASYGGCFWWFSLIAEAGTPYPSLLDCADAPGRAVEALRMGVKGLVLNCEARLFGTVRGLAEHYGAVLLHQAPPALDLAQRGAARRLTFWLESANFGPPDR